MFVYVYFSLYVFNARGKCAFMSFMSGRALLSVLLIKLAPTWEEKQKEEDKTRAVGDKRKGREECGLECDRKMKDRERE